MHLDGFGIAVRSIAAINAGTVFAPRSRERRFVRGYRSGYRIGFGRVRNSMGRVRRLLSFGS
jgi:hypothetical protein